MKFIALLPMKGNSERVPQKNYLDLVGKPLFFYIADTLKNMGIFENLVINTDNNKIANLATDRYGDWVVIHERPEELRGDYVPMYRINEYDIIKIGSEFQFLQTHSTNPLLKKNTIFQAIDKYKSIIKEKTHDSLFSVNEIRNRLYTTNLLPVNHDPKNLLRSQDNEPILEENSNLYIFNYESFNKMKSRLGENPFPFIIKSENFEALDIDNLIDWKLAEILISNESYFDKEQLI